MMEHSWWNNHKNVFIQTLLKCLTENNLFLLKMAYFFKCCYLCMRGQMCLRERESEFEGGKNAGIYYFEGI